MATTAERLKTIMELRRLRQVDIVRLAEPICKEYNLTLSKSDLSQFISGKVQPSQWKLTILGKALNVSEAWLMGEDVPMERTVSTVPSATTIDQDRLEALHQNPRLGLLFDRQRRMSESDVEFMLQMADRILQERDGD